MAEGKREETIRGLTKNWRKKYRYMMEQGPRAGRT